MPPASTSSKGVGQIPLDHVITGATLTVQVTSAGSGLRLHEMPLAWDLANITWNSAGNGIQADGSEAAAAHLLEVGVNDGGGNISEGPLQLDMTLALQRLRAGAAAGLGWALIPMLPDGTNGIDFYCAHWARVAERPLLTVQALPVPETGSTLMLGAGLLGLVTRGLRRRSAA